VPKIIKIELSLTKLLEKNKMVQLFDSLCRTKFFDTARCIKWPVIVHHGCDRHEKNRHRCKMLVGYTGY